VKECVFRSTLILFEKLQDWLSDALNTFISQLDDKLHDMERKREEQSQEITTRLETLEGTLKPLPTIPTNVPSTIQPELIPSNSTIKKYKERLDEHLETLSSAVINLQHHSLEKPSKTSITTKPRRKKYKSSSKRSPKSSSSSHSSDDSDDNSASSDSESNPDD
jgi:hypothetical protein